MTNKELYDKASRAISGLFYTAPLILCRANMERLIEEIKVLLEALNEAGGD